MLNFLATMFFVIGLLISSFAVGYFFVFLGEKISEFRERKQAHDKRLVTLLESIKQKLNTKP
jgi:hypothetical protein